MRNDPTLYEPKSMLCEVISTAAALLGSAAIGAGVSLFGGSQASDAAEDASDAQVRSAQIAADLGREGLSFQKDVFNIGRADTSPYRATGGAALHTLNNLFLPGGNSMVQMQGQLNELRAQRASLAGGSQPASAPASSAPASSTASPTRNINLQNAKQVAELIHPGIKRWYHDTPVYGPER